MSALIHPLATGGVSFLALPGVIFTAHFVLCTSWSCRYPCRIRRLILGNGVQARVPIRRKERTQLCACEKQSRVPNR